MKKAHSHGGDVTVGGEERSGELPNIIIGRRTRTYQSERHRGAVMGLPENVENRPRVEALVRGRFLCERVLKNVILTKEENISYLRVHYSGPSSAQPE